MGRVVSYVQEHERIFECWLSHVEQLLDCKLDHDLAFEAWADG
jgi:hypothetical protein